MCTYVIILVHRPLMTVLVGGNGKSTRRNHQKWRARCIGGGIYHDHSTLNGEWANMLLCGHHEGFYNFGWITKHSCVCMTSVEFLLVRGFPILTNPALYLWRNDWQQTVSRSNITDMMVRVKRIPALPPTPTPPLPPPVAPWFLLLLPDMPRYRFTASEYRINV